MPRGYLIVVIRKAVFYYLLQKVRRIWLVTNKDNGLAVTKKIELEGARHGSEVMHWIRYRLA